MIVVLRVPLTCHSDRAEGVSSRLWRASEGDSPSKPRFTFPQVRTVQAL
jgi:hypothetical protein